ncbi:MAG: hypothetical protein HKK67_07255 [Chlorobiaceae bacterium]|nr:hypothetical protein [Chlorobiaceae bacterium]
MTRQLNHTIKTAVTELQTCYGFNPILEAAIKTLGGDYTTARHAAHQLTTDADLLEIERTVRCLQVIKGKTYSKALEKENGRTIPELHDLGITRMLHSMHITEAELDRWYTNAGQTKFSYSIYSPLPDKADAKQLLDDIRLQQLCLKQAASDFMRIERESQALPEHIRLTGKSLRAAIECGMWPLFYPQHKEEACMLLQWEELPEAARLEYYSGLGEEEKRAVWQHTTREAREEATKALFDAHYCNKEEISNESNA